MDVFQMEDGEDEMLGVDRESKSEANGHVEPKTLELPVTCKMLSPALQGRGFLEGGAYYLAGKTVFAFVHSPSRCSQPARVSPPVEIRGPCEPEQQL